VTGDANLGVVVAVGAMQREQAMADIALGDIHDHTPRDRYTAGDIGVVTALVTGMAVAPGPVVTMPG